MTDKELIPEVMAVDRFTLGIACAADDLKWRVLITLADGRELSSVQTYETEAEAKAAMFEWTRMLRQQYGVTTELLQ